MFPSWNSADPDRRSTRWGSPERFTCVALRYWGEAAFRHEAVGIADGEFARQ